MSVLVWKDRDKALTHVAARCCRSNRKVLTLILSVSVSLFPLPPFRNTQLHINGRWHTWIDYDRFQELVASGKPFTALDYTSPTPEWALVGSATRGFDPREVRHRRGKPVD